MPTFIRVMISSRCNDPIQFGGAASTLSVVRQQIKQELEQIQLFGSQVFKVWINEDAPPAEGTADSWEQCLTQVRSADVVLVLYNGNAGWAKQGGDVGICHAELQMALATGAAKVRLIELPLSAVGAGQTQARNQRFRDYVGIQSLFRGAAATDGEQAMVRCQQALREAVVALAKLGVREARRGRYSTGDALEWHRLDYNGRRIAMRAALTGTLSARDGAQLVPDNRVLVRIAKRTVLFVCHAVPDAFTIPSALDTIGQPFLNDHLEVPHLGHRLSGPFTYSPATKASLPPKRGSSSAFPTRQLSSPRSGYTWPTRCR